MPNIEQYTGLYPRIDDPLMRAAYIYDIEISGTVYPLGTADRDQKIYQVVINKETADFLYSSFTPLRLQYQPGTRPLLERIITRILKPGMTERERVFAILKYSYSGFKEEFLQMLRPDQMMLNAVEEEVLKLNGGQCEDRSRVIICLCQVAGIPARLVASYPYFVESQGWAQRGGHAICEIFLEGRWCFFESLIDGFYCIRKDGKIASTWDIIQHPELAEQQSKEVMDHCFKDKDGFIKYRDDNLTAKQAITLSNYSVWDYWKYDWKWIASGKSNPNFQARQKMRPAVRRRVLTEAGIPENRLPPMPQA